MRFSSFEKWTFLLVKSGPVHAKAGALFCYWEDEMLNRNRNNKAAALFFRANVSCCFTGVGVIVVSALFLWLFFYSAAKMMPDFFQFLLLSGGGSLRRQEIPQERRGPLRGAGWCEGVRRMGSWNGAWNCVWDWCVELRANTLYGL